jgi:hypothetical protein
MEITHEQRQALYIKFNVEAEATDKLPIIAVCINCPLEFRGCKRTSNPETNKIFAMVSLASSAVQNARETSQNPNCGVNIQ